MTSKPVFFFCLSVEMVVRSLINPSLLSLFGLKWEANLNVCILLIVLWVIPWKWCPSEHRLNYRLSAVGVSLWAVLDGVLWQQGGLCVSSGVWNGCGSVFAQMPLDWLVSLCKHFLSDSPGKQSNYSLLLCFILGRCRRGRPLCFFPSSVSPGPWEPSVL